MLACVFVCLIVCVCVGGWMRVVCVFACVCNCLCDALVLCCGLCGCAFNFLYDCGGVRLLA